MADIKHTSVLAESSVPSKYDFPIIVQYRATEPAVSLIVPYAFGEPFNPIYICENDEVIIVFGGESIGHARIASAEIAKNDWLVLMDGDAVYPEDYIPSVKNYIRYYGYPVMCAKRKGGFGEAFFSTHEHGLIVRKDVFLERCKDYPYGVRDAGRRTDIADYFRDAVKIDVEYHHGLTKGETAAVGFATVLGVLCLALTGLGKN